MKMKGAEVLLKCMSEQGVDIVFGYPGGAVLPIYDALYSSKITHIMTAHEQGAAHAADGYARSTGKVGVVIATSGPGATNTVTGIATAYRDSVPMVVFTGQVSLNLLGKDSFQEVDIKDITASITKKNYIVKNVKDLADIVREAFKIAASGRPGPVLVDIPKNIQEAEVEYESGINTLNFSDEISSAKEEYDSNLDKAVDMIGNSERPVIYSGGGSVISGAQKELVELAEKMDSPVTCSLMGMGAFPGNHKNYMGMVGMHGSPCSNYAVSNCDLLIAIGARFSDRVISKVDAFAPGAKIIHIDIDEREFGKNINEDVSIKGDVREVLKKINFRIKNVSHERWMQRIKEWKMEEQDPFKENCKLSPKFIMNSLYKITKGDCIITTEVGQNQIWTAQYFKFLKPRTFISSGGLGTMGYGLGASIGASIGNPGKKVINVAGDGSFKMNSVELATISKYKLPIVQLLLNNHALGMVYQWQDMFYNKRFSNTELGEDVNFIKLAEAYDIEGFKIESNDEVEEVLGKALNLNKPVIVECNVKRQERVHPIVPPGAAITDIIQ
ncbi:biosynthetic-type acetolactate synthase large subunit [Clostridium luticellarii]|jgi:acetolactate synthase-1/2/3 large subunit|uniref:biosynthetic-type acetolactate synthase large subunit n=1 Tax=Clostridium luticellarii TaxID=1691940 RepID=UPI002352BB22|nr:biosynthetic-type acetolactate synthase large subunit [Clostridium luticellarii]MCI1968512.1 biosynthetic-type acetolactate synthase large subunit [Clostridium luticellarii]MCI1995965.1 biosynthetic-type acetolactate synthase large subunit [Clostridium luticellarii]MCI2040464.1 biosynthetic-type acetolactate synthase large subunit [Clostridium luticellarii]